MDIGPEKVEKLKKKIFLFFGFFVKKVEIFNFGKNNKKFWFQKIFKKKNSKKILKKIFPKNLKKKIRKKNYFQKII